MTGALPEIAGAGQARPPWLRPGALVAVAGLHACAVLFANVPRPALLAVDDSIEITVAQGTPEPEQPPRPPAPEPEPEPPPPPPEPDPVPPPEPPPPEPEPPPPPPEPPPPEPPPPEPEPPPEIQPPKREVREAPVIPLAKPKPPRPQPRPEEPSPQRPPETKPTGIQNAQDEAMRARANYAAKVLQEIRSRKTPAPDYGSVIVGFSINAAGDIVSATIVHSSGRRELDAIALRMVRAARPGPPPDGAFSGTTTINFVE